MHMLSKARMDAALADGDPDAYEDEAQPECYDSDDDNDVDVDEVVGQDITETPIVRSNPVIDLETPSPMSQPLLDNPPTETPAEAPAPSPLAAAALSVDPSGGSQMSGVWLAQDWRKTLACRN